MTQHRYEDDVFTWSGEQAALLRAGDTSALDREHIAEEIESLGVSLKRELRHRLARLIRHLLTYEFQSEFRSRSWKGTITGVRQDIAWLLEDSPSLRGHLDAVLPQAYERGRSVVLDETGLYHLPETCPYSIGRILDLGWWPDE